jgi:hypothetical protein
MRPAAAELAEPAALGKPDKEISIVFDLASPSGKASAVRLTAATPASTADINAAVRSTSLTLTPPGPVHVRL